DVWQIAFDEGDMSKHPERMVPAAGRGLGQRGVAHILDEFERRVVGDLECGANDVDCFHGIILFLEQVRTQAPRRRTRRQASIPRERTSSEVRMMPAAGSDSLMPVKSRT